MKNAFPDKLQRAQLADALKRLRIAAGLSGYRLAEQLGVDQSTVSRIERNRQRISVPQVDRWCSATDASDDQRLELLELAENALIGPRSWDEVAEGGSTNFQPETRELEARAGVMSFYQPAILPGLLQTATYARRLFSSGPAGVPPDLAERVMGRMERQRILYDSRKDLHFVVPEAVLRWPLGPRDEHVEQLDRLGEIMNRPNVELCILPIETTPVWRAAGFVIFDDLGDDDPFVHLELLTGPVNIVGSNEVAIYQQAFINLRNASAEGERANALLSRIIDDMQT